MLTVLLATSSAFAITPTGGVAGGVYVHTAENEIVTAPTVVGRIGLLVTENVWVEANIGWSGGKTRDPVYPYTLWDPRFDVAWGFVPGGFLNPFVRGGVGGQSISWSREKDEGDPYDFGYDYRTGDFLLEVGGGALVHIAGPVHIRTDLMYVPSFGDRDNPDDIDIYSNLEWTIGVDLRAFTKPDIDGDGIKNKVDVCPDVPEDMDGFDDADGCVDPDNDQDGVLDGADKCPEPEDKDSFEDDDGCPDPDNDQDGVLDAADKCPEPEDKDSFEDEDGCPDPDNDKDGILDTSDKCPVEPEVMNGYRDRDGCADEVPAAVKKFSGKIEGIKFETGKATIKKESNKVLDAAVAVLKEFDDVRMEVQGHTDDVGDDAKNLKLSQDRSQAVVDYFVKAGIAADRLVAKGYGETVPSVPNDSTANRALNRRVEFKLVQ